MIFLILETSPWSQNLLEMAAKFPLNHILLYFLRTHITPLHTVVPEIHKKLNDHNGHAFDHG